MLLDPADIETLTGYKRASCQARWLRERGWLFEIGGDRQGLNAKNLAGHSSEAMTARYLFVRLFFEI